MRSTHVVGFIYMWNMHGYFRIHRNIHSLLYCYVRKKQCLYSIIVHLFSLCRVVGHSLNSPCIVHRQCIRVYRRFSKGVGLDMFDLPLVLFILISICWGVEGISWVLWRFDGKRINVFTNSLMDATMQDGSTRERSDCLMLSFKWTSWY